MAQIVTPSFDEASLKNNILSFLDETRYVMLVTNAKDGWPMSRMMGFFREGWDLWFTTVAGSLKARQLTNDNKVTLLWKEPNGNFFKFLNIKGEIEVFEDEATVTRQVEKYWAKYGAPHVKNPDIKRIVMRVKVKYARAEGFGIAPPPILRNFE